MQGNTSTKSRYGIVMSHKIQAADNWVLSVQCFCFEEQMLNPHEEVTSDLVAWSVWVYWRSVVGGQVEMPVFFYIDPDFDEDPAMEKVNTITLSYTFFEVQGGHSYAIPTPADRENS